MFEREVQISQAAQVEAWEDATNARRLAKYLADVTEWIANYATAKPPTIPVAQDSTVTFGDGGAVDIRFFDTTRPLTDKTPQSFLPPHLIPPDPSEIGAEMKHMPGCFAFTGKVYPDAGTKRAKGGVEYTFFRGFFGLQGYWIKA